MKKTLLFIAVAFILISGTYYASQKVFVDGSGNVTINENLEINGNFCNINTDSISFRNAIAQYHRIDSVNTNTADAWIDVKFDTVISDETTYGYSFNSDSTGFILSVTGRLRIQGCYHWLWTGADNSTARIYTRILINGVEARCMNTNITRGRKTADNGDKLFCGTIYAISGQEVKLQYQVNDTDMDFEGDSKFDSPVAFSINFEIISN